MATFSVPVKEIQVWVKESDFSFSGSLHRVLRGLEPSFLFSPGHADELEDWHRPDPTSEGVVGTLASGKAQDPTAGVTAVTQIRALTTLEAGSVRPVPLDL